MVTKVTGSFFGKMGEHMNQNDGFYTMKGYRLQSDSKMTSAMEDYLEMITRLSGQGGSVRVSELSRMLHVKASSATKMVQQLVQEGFVLAERYGDIALTERGRAMGNYLLYRHDVIHRFLCLLNHSEDELEQAVSAVHELMQRLDVSSRVTQEKVTRALAEVDAEDIVKANIQLDKIIAFFESSNLLFYQLVCACPCTNFTVQHFRFMVVIQAILT